MMTSGMHRRPFEGRHLVYVPMYKHTLLYIYIYIYMYAYFVLNEKKLSQISILADYGESFFNFERSAENI